MLDDQIQTLKSMNVNENLGTTVEKGIQRLKKAIVNKLKLVEIITTQANPIIFRKRQKGFYNFTNLMNTPNEIEFAKLYAQAHELLIKKMNDDKKHINNYYRPIINHIDSIFKMADLVGKDAINKVKRIDHFELECLRMTIKDINNVPQNPVGYESNCKKLHKEYIIRNKRIIREAIYRTLSNRNIIKSLLQNTSYSDEQFISAFRNNNNDVIQYLTPEHTEALFNFIDMRINGQGIKRNGLVFKSEIGAFMDSKKLSEKMNELGMSIIDTYHTEHIITNLNTHRKQSLLKYLLLYEELIEQCKIRENETALHVNGNNNISTNRLIKFSPDAMKTRVSQMSKRGIVNKINAVRKKIVVIINLRDTVVRT